MGNVKWETLNVKRVHQLIQIPGRTAKTKDKEFLYFSGTNYLGIGQQPEFKAFIEQGLDLYGLNFGGSRLSNVRFEVYEEAESFLAKLGQAEAALTVSSGTLAGQLVTKHLGTLGALHYAPESHPALRDNTGKHYQSREDWESALISLSHQSGDPIIAISDAIDSLHVRSFEYDWLKQLGNRREFILVIDDSHTWGITGIDGGGTYTKLAVPESVELVVLGALGKAFGIPAGFVLGTKSRIKALWQNPFFGGASPALPAFLFAMLRIKEVYRAQRSKLFHNTSIFQKKAANLDCFNYSQDYPVFHTSANDLADYLLQQDIMISSFPYPTPDSDLVTRIVLNALHTQEDMELLGRKIQDFFSRK